MIITQLIFAFAFVGLFVTFDICWAFSSQPSVAKISTFTVSRSLSQSVNKLRHHHTTLRMASNVRALIDKAIADNTVIVFSKSYCPYCIRAKDAIKNEGYNYHAIELDVSTGVRFKLYSFLNNFTLCYTGDFRRC